jgi:hypothetical protein
MWLRLSVVRRELHHETDGSERIEHEDSKAEDWGRGKGVKLLRRVIMNLLASDAGVEVRPFADGPAVRALKVALVEAEFHKSYPATGGENKKAQRDAKAIAFRRAMIDAVDKGVVVTRELNGEDYVWPAKAGRAENA